MVIVVNGEAVSLDAPDDLQRFKVVVEQGDEETAGAALAGSGAGALQDAQTAWIAAEWVKAAAADRVKAATWLDEFESMLDYAETKGWVSDDRTEIQAHVEYR